MRLRHRREFLAVQKSGRATHGRHFLVVIAPQVNNEAHHERSGRLGITVSKKVGKAVVRNRVKRLVREYMRRNWWVPNGKDAVIIAKRGAGELKTYSEVASALAELGTRCRGRRSRW